MQYLFKQNSLPVIVLIAKSSTDTLKDKLRGTVPVSYTHLHNNWTDFHWKSDDIALLLDEVTREQGKLYGRLSSLGFDSQLQAMAENLTHDVVYSSEIEGIQLNADEVRSSIARRLGLENIKYTTPSHYVDAVVAVMLEATEHYGLMLTKQKPVSYTHLSYLSTNSVHQVGST